MIGKCLPFGPAFVREWTKGFQLWEGGS